MIKRKTIIVNFIVFLGLLIVLELILGDWLSKYNFGYHMRNKRLITYKINTTLNNQQYDFNYIRNFYGFRMDYDIAPNEIDVLFQGGSTGEEIPLPSNKTIVGQLNNFLSNDNIDNKVINAALSGKSTAGYNNDFKYWFPRLKDFKPKVIIFFSGHNDADIMQDNKNNLDEFDLEIENLTFTNTFSRKAYDYITNNSFILVKLKKIKDLYFDLEKHKVLYDLNKENLYKNYSYIDYDKAIKKYQGVALNAWQQKTLKFYRQNLNQLKSHIEKWNLEPIFVTQVRFDGISTHRLFFINEETKRFCYKNNFSIIKLDEIYIPGKKDYFDEIHTTPQGSLKVAEIIYPKLKEHLKKFSLDK